MVLSHEEAVHGALLLCESGTRQKWSQLTAHEQSVYIDIVLALADTFLLHKTPQGLQDFYAWIEGTS